MSHRFFVLALMTFCLGLELVGADDLVGAASGPGARLAARIEGLLDSLKETDYQHTTEINEAKGSVKCDCSGLVGFFLRHEFPEAYVSLKGDEAAWRKRPLSVTYYQTFVAAGANSGGPWQRVVKLQDAAPGDVLAWRKKTLKAGSTTGHTCMIAGKPEIIGDGKVRVRLIDSTRAPHENDTRPDGKTGMGAGYKTFLVNAEGECAGYLRGQRVIKSTIAIGRIVDTESATSHAADTDFIGLKTQQAIELAEQRERSWRIIRKDGEPQTLKWQIKDERLNFVIQDENVIRVQRG